MTSSCELSVVVLHFNRWNLTKDCLASIDTQEIPCSYEKVLVDNGSREPTIPPHPSWRVVKYQENKGHIIGQNRCFESAQGEWVLFVANDVRLSPQAISDLWRYKREDTITQPTLWSNEVYGRIDNRGLQWSWPGYGHSLRGIHSTPTTVSGSCYLMQKQIWVNLHGFDEFLRTSHEDIDFGLRANWQGYRADWAGSATHLGNATLKHQASHTRATFHRDRVYVIQKHYRGLDRLLRLAVVNLLDSLPRG